MISKKELRKEILIKRDALSLEERRVKSHQIAKKITQMKEFTEADKVLLFSSFKSEVDTTEIFETLVKTETEAYYPKVLGKEMEFYRVESEDDFEEGCWGIQEPKAGAENKFVSKYHEKICVIMPGAVFDEAGNRIGYGGGYYDKYLQQLEMKISKEQVAKIAVAFECQIVEEGFIFREQHDVIPDIIATEKRLIKI